MIAALQAGNRLSRNDWLDLQKRAIFDFGKWDIQCEDHSVLGSFPLLLRRATAEFLNQTAEALCKEALEAEAEILRRPELLGLLRLPRTIQKILIKSSETLVRARSVRVMRFDFHLTAEGWRISEVNADVPGGFVEASGWNSLFAEHCSAGQAASVPSEVYARAIHEAAGAGGLVAFVHATAYSDDRQVMSHLAQCFSRHSLRACLLSPAHLRWKEGRAEIHSAFASGFPDAIVRFFPADWLPNLSNKRSWQPYFQTTKTPLSNPGSALVLQTKRFPLVWKELKTCLSTWRRLLPETRDPGELKGILDDGWVLKPALGRVGEGIGMPGITPRGELLRIEKEARRHPREWVIQKRFDILAVSTEAGPKYPCIGVFTIGGRAAGFYGRIADNPIINQNAQDVAVLVNLEKKGATV